MSYYSLPFEVVLLIAQDSAAVWWRLAQVDHRVTKYTRDNITQVEDYFTRSYKYKYAIIFTLPNGITHRNHGPAVIDILGNLKILQKYPQIDLSKSQLILDDITIGELHTLSWYRYGKLHRDGDQPAVIRPYVNNIYNSQNTCVSTTKQLTYQWWVNGKLHRDRDQPAIITHQGDQSWWVNGKRHRDRDQPAIITYYGKKEWWWYGKHHRGNDQPAVIHDNLQEWYKYGRRHRDGGKPALIRCGGQEWWVKGGLHRDNDQPAINYHNGNHKEWWVRGALSRDGDQPAVVAITNTNGYVYGMSYYKYNISRLNKFSYQANGENISMWWQRDKLHRDGDKPAIEYGDGTKIWCYLGKLHRDNGQPAKIYANGDSEYWINGENLLIVKN
jgi:hypothetical protein